ncbi:MAG: YcgL domain-containing protein [Gammaproteobacteria bacterium]|nr:YcgL domain-containing protein [Gammaproteobacteria bacterium]
MKCIVYQGRRKPDHYLFVESEAGFGRVPEALTRLFGGFQLVMELDLAARSKLAGADPAAVESQIMEVGYYLQLPPR